MPKRIRKGPLVIGCSALLFVVLTLLLFTTEPKPAADAPESRPLVLFCAAGMRMPIEEIRAAFEKECGVRVDVQYGGSNTLLNQMQISKKADLYLAADRAYVARAREMGLVREILPIARMMPVIAVPEGNPKRIWSIDHILKPGVKLALGNPEQAAIGKAARDALVRSGHWEQVEALARENGVFKPTVPDVANTVKIGSVDAGIIWSATASQFEGIDGVRIPELDSAASVISIAVAADTSASVDALNFARYVTGANRGLEVFARLGYESVDGDPWEARTDITFFAGSVNRRGLSEAIKRFETREGVRVNTVFNGCGILTAQMRTIHSDGEFPDAYMACDQYYLDVVQDLFGEGTQISKTRIVIVVAEGNPKRIQSLEDLARPGIRLAVGQPEQCTIGVLSRQLLESVGLYKKLLENNVVTQTATSAMLVPAVTTGAADAVLAYRTDTLAEADKVDAIGIDSPLAKVVQPFALSRKSDQHLLGTRLFETITEARAEFEAAGFDWLLEGELMP
ncbi:MAG: molybdate ABC transporter substrate-binding protein [Kiritimatiellia bacterium]|jgi:molybdenum ABC transporter molybdate-binding protein|nr:molybdate ABC transporter substrate-binding protein [Kiritimatiellia bacterium]MDP6631065.1 molybdate ABC transporter substrate-binding protein [Kiritimatiellia bacterium]MDP6810021.1 molybdate ABC transporter substrate-binding protein [Kiritimatiellia bacterium]MDP7024792.1 molybdate ABC transporter substrate-binding protein [Kiritimatiellia bacterium]